MNEKVVQLGRDAQHMETILEIFPGDDDERLELTNCPGCQ